MSRNLCDETFPANLLIEFDELDDEIPISPEFPKRHHLPPEDFTHHRHHHHHHTTLSSGGKGIRNDKNNDDRNGSRMVVSGSSNTSSGHSSLSTEGENRSGSTSDRDTSRDLIKRLPHHASDAIGPGALLLLGEQRNTADKLTLKGRKIRQPRSMESLLQNQDQRLKLAVKPLDAGTGLGTGKGIGGGSTGNVSVSSVGAAFQHQQHYQRHRSKYGHVQSKVKQMIEEMKPPANRERKTLVRHKSMPETSFDVDSKHEEEESLERVDDVETLRSVVRDLQQQLTLCRTNVFNELATLQSKNSALRLENDHLLEQERAREQRRQLLRDQHTAGSCYGSQSSLYKAPSGPAATCTVATQTSPTDDLLFEFLLASPPTSSHPAAVPNHTASLATDAETPGGEFSPDYEQLIPMLGHSGGEDSSICRSELHRRRVPSVRSPAGRRSESGTAQDLPSPTCHDCKRKRKKRKSRKQKLASLFCIRHHDESL